MAEDPAVIRSQIEELEKELAKLKKEFACAGSGTVAASAAAAASSEQYRITYLGTIMVPASQLSGSSAAGSASVQASTVANLATANLAATLSRARLTSSGSRLTSKTAGGLGFNLAALTAATGQNAQITIPVANLAAAGANVNSANFDAASIQNQPLAVRVSGSAIRAAAARLSAAERATRMAYPNHQVVDSANFTSGIYRGTQFTAAPSTSNPFVGRYLQTPDGQLNTVMPVGQQFIVLP
jgi:hypothetical protein